MNELQERLVLGFALLIVIASLVLPVYLMYKSGVFVSPTARASAVGSIELTVSTAICGDGVCDAGLEDCSSCPADCGPCAVPEVPETPGGGSGGGGGSTGLSGSYVTHMLDFRLNDWYVVKLYREDRVITVFDDKTMYRFEVTELIVYDHLTLRLEDSGMSYLIEWAEFGLFDFDNDGNNDLQISFLDDEVKWLNLGVMVGEPSLLPSFEKEKEDVTAGMQFPQIIKRFDFILLVLIILALALAVFIYHQIKIHGLEKKHGRKMSVLSREYRKVRLKREERAELRVKLNKKMRSLREAHSSKIISENAYKKGTDRLDKLLKKTMVRDRLNKKKKVLKEAYASKYISQKAFKKGKKGLNKLLRKT